MEDFQMESRPFRDEFFIPQHYPELDPAWKVQFQGVTYYISNPYLALFRKSPAFFVIIEKDGIKVGRTYFQSRSQVLFRMLKAYKYETREGKEQATWHDKGYGEESIMAPWFLQEAFGQILEKTSLFETLHEKLFFYGTVQESGTIGMFEQDVSKTPLVLEGNFYTDAVAQKIPPNQLLFKENSQQQPNFEHTVAQWNVYSEMYGNCTTRIFTSFDKKFHYIIAHGLTYDQVWIAGIDNESEISRLGIRKQWIDGGDLTTPAFEYLTAKVDQTGGYGNETLRRENYVDMSLNYLNHILVIKEYRSHIVY